MSLTITPNQTGLPFTSFRYHIPRLFSDAHQLLFSIWCRLSIGPQIRISLSDGGLVHECYVPEAAIATHGLVAKQGAGVLPAVWARHTERVGRSTYFVVSIANCALLISDTDLTGLLWRECVSSDQHVMWLRGWTSNIHSFGISCSRSLATRTLGLSSHTPLKRRREIAA